MSVSEKGTPLWPKRKQRYLRRRLRPAAFPSSASAHRLAAPKQNAGTPREDADTDARVAALKQELRAKEEYLQTSNEELETSKEELQSVNEELAKINAEMQQKMADLSRANNDMNNLLAGTVIGTIFVDHQLRILRFTPAASQVINLILSDVGRPVGSHRLQSG